MKKLLPLLLLFLGAHTVEASDFVPGKYAGYIESLQQEGWLGTWLDVEIISETKCKAAKRILVQFSSESEYRTAAVDCKISVDSIEIRDPEYGNVIRLAGTYSFERCHRSSPLASLIVNGDACFKRQP